jgi:DNA (cytosine-5)-methyltransferase 1
LGAGIEGNKSSMWKHMARIIGEVRPRYAYVENSPMLTFRGLGVVLADLSTLGYDCKWGIISAASVGAPHLRERIWLKAEQREFFSNSKHNGDGWRQQQPQSIKETSTDMAHTNSKGLQGRLQNGIFNKEGREKQGNGCTTKCNIGRTWDGNSKWWDVEPDVGRVAHGVACRVDRLKAIGNGQVSAVAATAWSILSGT